MKKRLSYAKCRNRMFPVWIGATKDDVVKMLNQWHKGIIIVCPVCKHVDIDPYTHFFTCDAEAESQRVMNQEYYD